MAEQQTKGAMSAAERAVPKRERRLVTGSDYYRDQIRNRNPLDRLGAVSDIRGLLRALGFDMPRELYHPGPEQNALLAEKTLRIVPKDVAPSDGPRKDCSVRFCAPRSCWLYIQTLEVTPLNLTASESLVVRFGLHCGTQRSVVDFCEIISQSNEEPGQYTKPQNKLVPPTGCLVVDFYNLDDFSEADVGIEAKMWLIPDTVELP